MRDLYSFTVATRREQDREKKKGTYWSKKQKENIRNKNCSEDRDRHQQLMFQDLSLKFDDSLDSQVEEYGSVYSP